MKFRPAVQRMKRRLQLLPALLAASLLQIIFAAPSAHAQVSAVPRPAAAVWPTGGPFVNSDQALRHYLLTADVAPPPSNSPDDFANSGEDLGQYLGPIYKDEVAGIKIAPPVGSRIINRAGLDLVSFVNDAKQWGGDVQMVVVKQKMSIADYLTSTAGELGKTFRDVQVLDSRELTFQGHDAGRISITMQAELGAIAGKKNTGGPAEIVSLFRQQLVVQLADNQFLVLMLYVPLKDQKVAATTFEAMLSTFEILNRQELVKRREAAVVLGKQWLAQRTADELKNKLQPTPQLFRMKAGGADIGFLRFDLKEASRQNTTGIQVAITSRGFRPTGENASGQYIAYWAYSGTPNNRTKTDYSSWESTTKTVLNRPNVPLDRQTFWVNEVGTVQLESSSRFSDEEIEQLRKEREELLKDKTLSADKVPPPIPAPVRSYHMHVIYGGDPSQPPVPAYDVSIALEHPAVLPSVLDYLWPRVVDLTKPSEMTFVAYSADPKNKKLMYRTLSVIGKDRIMLDQHSAECTRCQDEIGDAITTLWVDADGKILMMRTGDQSLLMPTTDEEMARLWATRIQQPH
jgi:hypothetical protein